MGYHEWMRTLGLLFLLGAISASVAGDGVVDTDVAKEAIKEFKAAYKQKELEAKQGAVFDLHDVPHPLIVKQLSKLLGNRNTDIAQVAALAMGGQSHDVPKTGKVLLKFWDKRKGDGTVRESILGAWKELKFMGYWPKLKPSLRDKRNSLVIGTLSLLGSNKDFRSLPKLLEMYHVAMPRRVKWATGEVKVDTGAAGDADQQAAEAAFNKKYGAGGSKAKAKAKAKAKSFDERNFANHLRRCVKAITGEDFDTALDFEDWYLENYLLVARKMAEINGTSVEKAVAKAKMELPAFRAKVEDRRKKYEEEAARARKK